ncbi:MAG: hypothetical protein FJ315_06050 [SAR202 cluster bacterium]|nr:hypothetical protein [SAR202 cluster bacterium]
MDGHVLQVTRKSGGLALYLDGPSYKYFAENPGECPAPSNVIGEVFDHLDLGTAWGTGSSANANGFLRQKVFSVDGESASYSGSYDRTTPTTTLSDKVEYTVTIEVKAQ